MRRIHFFTLVLVSAFYTHDLFAEGPRGLPSKFRKGAAVEEEEEAQEEPQQSETKGVIPGKEATSVTGALSKLAKTGVLVYEPQWWKAERASYSVGYEATGAGTLALPGNAVALGTWINDRFGIDVFVGLTKSADSATSNTSTVADTVAATSTTTTTHTGSRTPANIVVGGVFKYRLIQTNWFQLSAGFILAASPPMTSNYQTGTRAEVTPNTADPGTRTITETAYGTIKAQRSILVFAGPKLGTEFYIKWFPNLAVGFSTGIVTTLGGDTTLTTNTANRTIPVLSNTELTPTANVTTSTVNTVSQGIRGATFGLGGTTFSFTGTFSLRYIW